MRAIVLDGAGQPALGDVPEPEGGGELVRVRACGLCGTDVQKLGRAAPGTVLGHEVVAEGEDGRRVALVHHLPCGECERCRAGHETTCERFPAPTIVPGGFAERARAAAAVPLPDGLDDATGTFAEPLACVLRALDRIPRGRVLVVGCGFAGLLFVQALVRRGDDVLAADPLPHRLDLALGYGAEPVDGPVDAAVLCAHAGLGSALAALEPGGTLLVFSWLTDPAALDFELVLRRELALVGSCSATPASMRDAVALLPGLDPVPTVTLPLERFAEGLELYRSHEAVKVVFTP
ncbi:MAG TPA: alcohol dehydrogenase catalytic domain-containing protein [Gaiellaceae bacterium]|nr:alcohol dehydrogenase catalytic domain-containing protein [Gaiellaceae bacterium]